MSEVSRTQFGEQLEAVGLAYGSSDSVLRFVQTTDGNEFSNVDVSEFESIDADDRDGDESIERFIGEDAAGVRIVFEIEYGDLGVEDVRVLRGRAEENYGSLQVVVIE